MQIWHVVSAEKVGESAISEESGRIPALVPLWNTLCPNETGRADRVTGIRGGKRVQPIRSITRQRFVDNEGSSGVGRGPP